jgi:hypothetical protein
MQDPPSSIEFLDLVVEFLRTVAVSQLSGQHAFHARVAVNALQVVKRELQQGSQAHDAEHDSLRALLGADGSLDALNAQLARAIRSGELTLASPGVADHVWQTTLAKMAIDQPTYAPYRAELSQHSESR